jgi:iron(III) transport system ATP-binding protein
MDNILPEYRKNQKIMISVRPEELLLSPNAGEFMKAKVKNHTFLGLNTHYIVELESGEKAEIIQESTIDSVIEPGTAIKLTLNTEKVNVFTADGSANILTGVRNDCANA